MYLKITKNQKNYEPLKVEYNLNLNNNEKIQDIGKDSVPTKTIGEFILKALKERDKIGYVRFYGVFKKVNDPKEYKRIVDTLH